MEVIVKLLVKNAYLNDKKTDILIKNNIFEKIAPEIEEDDCEIFHAQGMIAIPPLANSHTHAAMSLLRAYADDLELFDWLKNYIWPLEAKLSEDDIYWGTRLACLEMIRTGTCCFNDMYWQTKAIARAVEDAGIRAVLAHVVLDGNNPNEAQNEEVKARAFFAENHNSSLIKYALGPHAIYTVSQKSLEWIAKLSKEKDLLLHIHIAETKKEFDDCLQEHGLTPIKYLHSLGLLGHRSLLAHCVWLTEEDVKLIAEAKATVLHNPVSNLKLASGFIPLKLLKEYGVNIALGTDGCSSNNNLSILEEMKFSALLPKFIEMDPKLYPAKDVFNDASLTTYKALAIDGGEIKEGKLADFILLKQNTFLTPNYNTISNLVYSADSSCVDTLICNGSIIMNRGKVADEDIILNKVNEISRKLINK